MVWEIALVIFLLLLSVLVLLVIPVVLQLSQTLKKVNQSLEAVNKDLPAIVTNVHEVTDTVNLASKKLKDAIYDLAELEHSFSREVKEPLNNIAKGIGMVLNLINKLFPKRWGK